MRVRRILSVLPMLALLLVACGSPAGQEVELAPLSALPQDIQEAPVKVREAYQFALANPDLLKQIPCYCGCGAVGHSSNYDCYVAETSADGSVVFDYHAFG